MQRHYGAISQLLQGITNPMIPEESRAFLLGSIKGMSYIMGKLLRAFNYDDVLRMQPELQIIRDIEAKNKQQGANNGQRTISGAQGTSQNSDGRPNIQETEGAQNDNSGSSQPSGTGGSGGILFQ
jgi:hypothetical protein